MKVFKKNIVYFLLVFILSITLNHYALASDAVAMITDLKGDASLLHNNEKKSCEILTSVIEGDEIELNSDSELTLVYFNTSKEYKLAGQAIIKINAESPTSNLVSKVQERDLEIIKSAGLKPSDTNYSQAAIVFRNAAKKPKIQLIKPVNTKILNPSPTFEWLPLENIVNYRYMLFDDTGRTVLEKYVEGVKFKLPSDIKIEAETLYSWQIEARMTNGEIYARSTNFSLIDTSTEKIITELKPNENANFSDRLLFAMLLDQYGLRTEAQDYWKKLINERPDSNQLTSKIDN